MSSISRPIGSPVASPVGGPLTHPIMGGGVPTLAYDFSKSLLTPTRIKAGSPTFSRNSVAWGQAYDESTGNLKWVQVPANTPSAKGLRWTGTEWTPYKTDGSLIPNTTRRGMRLQAFSLTNSIPNSRDFSTWTAEGTPSPAKNVTGFDGVANAASTLTDNDALAIEGVKKDITVTADTNTHTARFRVGVDTDETRFPAIGISVSGRNSLWHLNTKTGATSARDAANHASAAIGVYQDGNFWVCSVSLQNDGVQTTLTVVQRPADGTIFGTSDVAATGSAVLDQAELFLNKTIAKVKHAEPIVTTGAAVTRLADDFRPGPIAGNFNQAQGSVLVGWEPLFDSADAVSGERNGIVAVRDNAESILYTQDQNKIRTRDGANVATATYTWSAGVLSHVSSRHSQSLNEIQTVADQVASAVAPYDGAYDASGADLRVGYGAAHPVIVRYLEIYDRDLGASKIATKQAAKAAEAA